MERAILTPLNEDVDAINNEITRNVIQQIDGSSITTRKYYSADTILEHDRNSMYPTEYLNKLNLHPTDLAVIQATLHLPLKVQVQLLPINLATTQV